MSSLPREVCLTDLPKGSAHYWRPPTALYYSLRVTWLVPSQAHLENHNCEDSLLPARQFYIPNVYWGRKTVEDHLSSAPKMFKPASQKWVIYCWAPCSQRLGGNTWRTLTHGLKTQASTLDLQKPRGTPRHWAWGSSWQGLWTLYYAGLVLGALIIIRNVCPSNKLGNENPEHWFLPTA